MCRQRKVAADGETLYEYLGDGTRGARPPDRPVSVMALARLAAD